MTCRIIRTESLAGHICRNDNPGDKRLRKTRSMDNIAIERVVARRHGRQRDAKVARPCQLRMKMEDRIHLWLADRIKVHQVSVVRQKIVVGARSPWAVWTKGSNVEIEQVS